MKWVATLAVAAAVVGLCSAASPCPDPFVNLGTDPALPKCLLFFSGTGTWQGLELGCEQLGAKLATVTGDLHNSVNKYILDRPVLNDKCFWIGGNDVRQEGHFVWAEDDTKEIPLGGPHWDPCEPEPDGGTKENYIAICPDRFYYKDYPGDRMFHGICQKFI